MKPPDKHETLGVERTRPISQKGSLSASNKGHKSCWKLPIEILSRALDDLPIPDLVRCAGVCRQLRGLVYQDDRWVDFLKLIGAWDRRAAKAHLKAAYRLSLRRGSPVATANTRTPSLAASNASAINTGDETTRSSTLTYSTNVTSIPASSESNGSLHVSIPPKSSGVHSNDSNTSSSGQTTVSTDTLKSAVGEINLLDYADEMASNEDEDSARLSSGSTLSGLQVIPAQDAYSFVHSVPSMARRDFAQIYYTLAPLYHDLARRLLERPALNVEGNHANSNDKYTSVLTESTLFTLYHDPESQAKILNLLLKFSAIDCFNNNFSAHEESLKSFIRDFTANASVKFNESLDAKDKIKYIQYARALVALGEGLSAVSIYIEKVSPSYKRSDSPEDCIVEGWSHANLANAERLLSRLASGINRQSQIIDDVFGDSVPAITPFAERILEDDIYDYLSRLLEEMKSKYPTPVYLSGSGEVYALLMAFVRSLREGVNSKGNLRDEVFDMLRSKLDPKINELLDAELLYYQSYCEEEVNRWEEMTAREEAATETLLMSNVNRTKEKNAFLAAFRKVVLMPVNAVTSAVGSGSALPLSPGPSPLSPLPSPDVSSRPSSLYLKERKPNGYPRSPIIQSPILMSKEQLPSSEFDAQAAIMANKLEGIRTLFSLEVALNIVKASKESIERIGLFVLANNKTGKKAKEDCEKVFITLLATLGMKHIKGGFDRAVDHLCRYDPKELQRFSQHPSTVEPLCTFLELVNVGDLIQQMIDVFFQQELVAKRYVDRNDFLGASIKEKRKFEQMLDERVASGLNRGIEVLIEQVDFILHTVQLGNDFNPPPSDAVSFGYAVGMDIGPTTAARKVVELLQTHVDLLDGTTEKSVLDVFKQELGMRLFGSLCKHLKSQTISSEGAAKLISDLNYYYTFIESLRQPSLNVYFIALKTLGQVYLVDASEAKSIGQLVGDVSRFDNIFRSEELYEMIQRRQDWPFVRKEVEKALFGLGIGDCCIS